MATGHFLRIGDKTTCGGSILSGSPHHSFGGIATARNGDSVSCGKDGKVYHIAGGIPNYFIRGVAAAGTLNSRSTCPCNARFISSFPNASYWLEEAKPFKAAPVAVPLVAAAPSPEPTKVAEPEQHAQAAKKKVEAKREPVDAGFCVLPFGAETGAYETWLFESEPPAGTRELYRSLNGAGKEYKAGSIMLVVDPEKQVSNQIEHMKAAKQRIDNALEPLTHKEANFLHNHYATIANFSNIAVTCSPLINTPRC
ncbi:PAAR domain-containing protein [Pantoea allii]|uniref:PAAR domain-containing protein n=1 Tax=Pantoea allii TaxID=574096 RepID=UPI001F4E7615|nr:PAAR domain-containing protein [Pantoea allii]MCH9298073.1 PAAR domain-containing protein [Pantoea allii]